jgi:hypothetical protein
MRASRSFILATLLVAAGCSAEHALTATPDGNAIHLEGVIDQTTPAELTNALALNTAATEILLQNIPGSADDEANLTAARSLRDVGIGTRVPADGVIASGGTDLFLAGAKRQIETGACVGVHSWATGGLFGVTEGRDVPRDDPAHQVYLNYYNEMGIPEDFYWYTLEVASAAGIHWMSPADINRFGLTTTPVGPDGFESNQARAARCNARLDAS